MSVSWMVRISEREASRMFSSLVSDCSRCPSLSRAYIYRIYSVSEGWGRQSIPLWGREGVKDMHASKLLQGTFISYHLH